MAKLKQLIAAHPQHKDFGTEIIVKDRFGAGGELIFKVAKNDLKTIAKIISDNPQTQFVLQPFLLFDEGFTYDNKQSAADIRLIYHNGKVIQTYIRQAKKDEFRCNAHQGGTSTYLKKDEVPTRVKKIAASVMQTLKQNLSFFALDFVVSNRGKVYLLEGNIRPGIYWEPGSAIEEKKSKFLINKIVEELHARTMQLATR